MIWNIPIYEIYGERNFKLSKRETEKLLRIKSRG